MRAPSGSSWWTGASSIRRRRRSGRSLRCAPAHAGARCRPMPATWTGWPRAARRSRDVPFDDAPSSSPAPAAARAFGDALWPRRPARPWRVPSPPGAAAEETSRAQAASRHSESATGAPRRQGRELGPRRARIEPARREPESVCTLMHRFAGARLQGTTDVWSRGADELQRRRRGSAPGEAAGAEGGLGLRAADRPRVHAPRPPHDGSCPPSPLRRRRTRRRVRRPPPG